MRLALLPHLTGPELDELDAALAARIHNFEEILRIAQSPDTRAEITERLRCCQSLTTAVREAKYQTE